MGNSCICIMRLFLPRDENKENEEILRRSGYTERFDWKKYRGKVSMI